MYCPENSVQVRVPPGRVLMLTKHHCCSLYIEVNTSPWGLNKSDINNFRCSRWDWEEVEHTAMLLGQVRKLSILTQNENSELSNFIENIAVKRRVHLQTPTSWFHCVFIHAESMPNDGFTAILPQQPPHTYNAGALGSIFRLFALFHREPITSVSSKTCAMKQHLNRWYKSKVNSERTMKEGCCFFTRSNTARYIATFTHNEWNERLVERA